MYSDSVSGIDIMFEAPSYTVVESNNFIEVCVIASDVVPLERAVEFSITTLSDSATQSVDFTFPFQNSVFTFDSLTLRQCANITILPDNLVENPELFTVNLASSDTAVKIQTPVASVTIIDNSEVPVRFENDTYEVTEGEQVAVCVVTLVPLARDITVTLNVDNNINGM